jgi:hypothetical protein
MTAEERARQERISREKFQRARELVNYCDVVQIEIGWEVVDGEEVVTFTPADACPQRLIEEVTILSPYIKAVKEQQGRR